MKVWFLTVALVVCGCSKKKEAADKAPPPASTEPAAPQPTTSTPQPTVPDPGAVGGGGESGSATGGSTGATDKKDFDSDLTKPRADKKSRMPSDDGGEATPKPMPSDDGGEAAKKACNKKVDCAGDQDCCNGFCYKQGTAKHSIECKLPSGKL